MWQFTAHHAMRPPLWTWARLRDNGAPLEKSATSFFSYEEAFKDAVRHGFDPKSHAYEQAAAYPEAPLKE